MITPKDGYILPSEMRAFYRGGDKDDYYYLGMGILTKPQPDGIRDDKEYGYRQNVRLKYNDEGGSSGFTRNHSLTFSDTDASFNLAQDATETAWSTNVASDSKTNGQRVTTKQSNVDLRVDNAVLRSSAENFSNTLDNCSIDAIYLEREPDTFEDAFGYFETTGSHKTSPGPYLWSPYSENEAASAYVMKDIAITNTIVTNAKTFEGRTYPLIRAYVSPSV